MSILKQNRFFFFQILALFEYLYFKLKSQAKSNDLFGIGTYSFPKLPYEVEGCGS